MDEPTRDDFYNGKRVYKCKYCQDSGFVFDRVDATGREFYKMCSCHPMHGRRSSDG